MTAFYTWFRVINVYSNGKLESIDLQWLQTIDITYGYMVLCKFQLFEVF